MFKYLLNSLNTAILSKNKQKKEIIINRKDHPYRNLLLLWLNLKDKIIIKQKKENKLRSSLGSSLTGALATGA